MVDFQLIRLQFPQNKALKEIDKLKNQVKDKGKAPMEVQSEVVDVHKLQEENDQWEKQFRYLEGIINKRDVLIQELI